MVHKFFRRKKFSEKRDYGVFVAFLLLLLIGIAGISSGVLSDNITGNSIKNFAEYKGGEQFNNDTGEISVSGEEETISPSVKGFENGKEKKEDIVSDNFILSSYGTPLELIGKGTTPTQQELLYKFKTTNKNL